MDEDGCLSFATDDFCNGFSLLQCSMQEFDVDEDGCLSAREAEEMWSTAPGE